MTIEDITAAIEKALASAGLTKGLQPLRNEISETIRDALGAAGLQRTPEPEPEPGTGTGTGTAQRVEPRRRPTEVGGMRAGSYSNGQAHRDYKLFVPSTYDGTPMPLVVMLHGCKQNGEDFARGTRMNELAQAQGFLVVYPEQLARANGSNCWNWFVPSEQARGGEEPALIAGIARRIGESHAVDPEKVFVAGLSAGAAMAVILGAAYPQVFKGVGVHSGLPVGAAHDVPSAFAAMQSGAKADQFGGRPAWNKERFADSGSQGVRTIVFHGDADTTVNASNGARVVSDALRRFTEDAGIALTEVVEKSVQGGRAASVAIYLDDAGRSVVESWRVQKAGHAWSGGSPAGSFTDAKGPDASREMVRFFLAG